MLENLRNFFSYAISCVAERVYSPNTIYLPANSNHTTQSVEEGILRRQLEMLSQTQKNQVYHKVWELAKMEEPRISGDDWGCNHAFDNSSRLHAALCRLGFFSANSIAHPIRCLPSSFGEGGIGSQYFSLSEKASRESIYGQIGYVNGMGVPSLGHAGKDVARFSDQFAHGNNIHCIYHATHQATPSGDLFGFVQDLLRMEAVEGGSYTKTSYLIAQQWIDFLDRYPNKNYLQIAHSEGTVHVNAALRLINASRPELLNRIRILSFCPAHFIFPETYGQGLQVINLYKVEDSMIPWARNIYKTGSSNHIVTVKHSVDHPHNHLSEDYIREGRRYVDMFMQSGNIY